MLQLKILGVVTIIGAKRHAFRVSFEQSLIGMLYHRNLDARAPPAPRDPAPLLLRPAQAGLNFGSGPAHPAHPADRHPTTNCQPLTRGPEKGQGSPKWDHCIFIICACQNSTQDSALSVRLPVNSHSPYAYLPNTACPVCLAYESSHK
jgi:hypothetical protein